MISRKSLLIVGCLANLSVFAHGKTPTPSPIDEIPKLLERLTTTALEDERLESAKKIHDIVVESDLTNPKAVKRLDPIIDEIRIAMDSGFDRTNISGQAMWLGSAVDYYEEVKLRPVIDVPESDWAPAEETALSPKLSTYPDKIMVHTGPTSVTVVQSSNIHEAVLSPDGTKVAYFRRGDSGDAMEIWVARIRNKRQKRVAVVPSCYTLVFSLKGNRVYFQSRPKKAGEDSTVFSVSASGGKVKPIHAASLLETVVLRGKYRGHLVVYKPTAHPLGIAERVCAHIVHSGNGREIGRVRNGPCR